MVSVFLLSGNPGVGKTTIIRKTLSAISIKAGGFYTEEIRENGIRKGFQIITLDGQESILAHTNFSTSYRVGKYAVNVENLNTIAVPAIYNAIYGCDLIVIDEIGKMELFSSDFKKSVLDAVNSGRKVLGTIMRSTHPFTDELKRNPKVMIFMVTTFNRDEILKKLIHILG